MVCIIMLQTLVVRTLVLVTLIGYNDTVVSMDTEMTFNGHIAGFVPWFLWIQR